MNSLDYSIELLKKINRLRTLDGQSIVDLIYYNGISAWSFHQYFLWKKILDKLDGFSRKGRRPGFFIKLTALVIMLICAAFLIIKMRLIGSKVLVLSVDKGGCRQDQRIKAIFSFLHHNKISYGEILHASEWSQMLSNLLCGRLAFYYTITNLLFVETKKTKYQFNWQEFNEEEQAWLRDIVSYFLESASFSLRKIKWYKLFLRLSGAKTILSIDDPRYYNEMIEAAYDVGINFYAFQHGRFSKYLVGYINYEIDPAKCAVPDVYVIWNEYWRDKLISLSPTYRHHQNILKVGGRPSIFNISGLAQRRMNDNIITILLPYELLVDELEIQSYIEKFLTLPNVLLIFKLRKDEPRQKQLKKLGTKNWNKVTVQEEITASEWSEIDLVVGTYSTMLYEAVEMGLPVGVLQTSCTQANDLVESNLAMDLSLADSDFERKVRSAAGVSRDELLRRAAILRCDKDIVETLTNLCVE